MASDLRRWAPLAALGLACALAYQLAFGRLFPLAEWWQHARLDYAWLTQYELSGQLRFVGAFLLLFAVYQLTFLRLRRQPDNGPLWLILGLQAVQAIPLLSIYPVAALDVFDYVLYGRLGLYWDANPLAHRPSEFPGEPLLAYSYWPDEPSVYGPLWQIASEGVVAAAGGLLLESLVGFKLLALASAIVTTALIWLTLRQVRPALAPAGALLYGWNPLQQFETAGNGHNDALMVAFLALALLLLAWRRWSVVLPAFSLGLLVKITLAPLAPLLALAPLVSRGARRARVRAVFVGSLLALLVIVGFYAPFWEGRATLAFLDRGNWFTASPPTLLREVLRQWYAFETAGRIAATLSGALFALIALGLLARLVWRPYPPGSPAFEAVVRTGYHLFFAYLVVACLWWQPWYLLVLLVLAAVAADRRLADRTNLFCIGGLLSYPVFKYIWAVHQVDWGLDYVTIMALSVVVIFTLPLLHTGLDLIRPRPAVRAEQRAPAAGSAR